MFQLGFYTTATVCRLYETNAATLIEMRGKGLLHPRPPRGLSRPLYYRRDELDSVFLGAVATDD